MPIDTDFKLYINSLPDSPGVYIYRNKNSKVIYVGKAKNIKKRVKQYFQSGLLTKKTAILVSKINSIEYIKVVSEKEALILENQLIKEYMPKYNILLKDDKDYSYIIITLSEDYPRIFPIHIRSLEERNKLSKNNVLLGPYPSITKFKNILNTLRRMYPFRTCNIDINKISKDKRKCIYYDLGLCNAPCDKLVSKNEYRKNILNIEDVLTGKGYKLINSYKRLMNDSSDRLDFEEALKYRNIIKDLIYVMSKVYINEKYNKNSIDKTLIPVLNNIFNKVKAENISGKWRIECYDISNFQESYTVGSMVVFENGMPKKSDYRKFKMSILNKPNDFARIHELISRRLSHLQNKNEKDMSFKSRPDLIIIDGGMEQLKMANSSLTAMNISIPIVSLAKKEELIYFPHSKVPLRLDYYSDEMYLIQRIRDEAHRFAITYHRLLRSKGMKIDRF